MTTKQDFMIGKRRPLTNVIYTTLYLISTEVFTTEVLLLPGETSNTLVWWVAARKTQNLKKEKAGKWTGKSWSITWSLLPQSNQTSFFDCIFISISPNYREIICSKCAVLAVTLHLREEKFQVVHFPISSVLILLSPGSFEQWDALGCMKEQWRYRVAPILQIGIQGPQVRLKLGNKDQALMAELGITLGSFKLN